jgi:hypothetical protein
VAAAPAEVKAVAGRWVALVSLASLLAGCSGSNAMISLGEGEAGESDDAAPAAEASADDGSARPPDDGGAGVPDGAPGDDASFDATVEASASDDASDAAPDAGDASDAATPAEAGADAEPPTDASADAALEAGADAAVDGGDDATTPQDATVPDDGGDDASPGDDGGSADAGADADAGVPACAAPSASVGWFVDQARGTDDPQHGGAAGACAFKTITYALTVATGPVFVAAGTYSSASGETLPFVLGGHQGLFCKNATLRGEATHGSTRANLVLQGTANAVNGCTIVGNAKSGACIIVASDGSGGGHDLESLDVSSCGDAAVRVQGTQVTIANSSFYDSARGVVWEATDPTGDLDGNWFDNNTDVDIACTGADTSVTGTGNQDGAGVMSCAGCSMCPFE